MKPLPGCLCFDTFVCTIHRNDPTAYAKEEADALDDECPWNPDDLPEHLRGFGHRLADQDGGAGDEWVEPDEDFEAQRLEAIRLGCLPEFLDGL